MTVSATNSILPAGRLNLRWLVAGAVLVALIAAIGWWASQPTYVTLYRDLDLRESGQIADQLAKGRIAYRLENGGTEVLVPAANVAAARVALAKEGLPSSGRPGLELFDKPSWGMTDFAQRVTFQRALEGELARTIGAIQGVERAQVHLVLGSSSGLRRLDRPAGASVVLTLKNGVTLSPESVQGIVYIVSNSVEQLSADNVAVMDDAGRVLSVPSATAGATGSASRHLDVQHGMEQALSDKIVLLLETIVGTGRVRAEVSAVMSFDQVDRTVESYNPDGAVLQNEQRSEADASPSAGTGAQTVVNNLYQNSRSVERKVGGGAELQKLTVAVLVDQDAMGKARNAAGAPIQTAELERMVRDAVGADSTRGDRVTLLAVPFEAASLPEAGAGGDSKKAGPDVIVLAERVSRPIAGLVAVIALLLVGLRVLKPASGAPSAGVPAPGGEAAGGAPAGAPAQLAANGDSQEAAAQVLRAWLATK